MADTKDVKALKKELKEKDELIHALRTQNDELKDSCKAAFAEARFRQEQLDNLLIQVDKDMAYLQKTTANFAETVLRVTKSDQVYGGKENGKN